MPRPPKPYWEEAREAYYTSAGGKRKRLNYPDGSPVRKEDHQGKVEALARVIRESREQAEEEARAGEAGMSVWEVFQAFTDWSRRVGRRRNTIDGHVQILNAIASHPWKNAPLGNLPAAEFGLEQWASYQKAMVFPDGRPKAPRTIEAHLASLKACWRWAARSVVGREPEVLISADPFRDCLLELKPERRRVRGVLSPAEVATLLKAVDEHSAHEGWRLAVRIQAEAGCRTQEVLDLRWEWWRGTHFAIPPAEHKTGHHKGQARIIAVARRTAERLEALRQRARGDYLIEGRWPERPSHMNTYQKEFAAALARTTLNQEIRPYWLRDYVADELRRQKIAGKAADDFAGNASGVRSRHYETTDPGELAEIADRLARRLDDAAVGWPSGAGEVPAGDDDLPGLG